MEDAEEANKRAWRHIQAGHRMLLWLWRPQVLATSEINFENEISTNDPIRLEQLRELYVNI